MNCQDQAHPEPPGHLGQFRVLLFDYDRSRLQRHAADRAASPRIRQGMLRIAVDHPDGGNYIRVSE
jgi:hypothetical protein